MERNLSTGNYTGGAKKKRLRLPGVVSIIKMIKRMLRRKTGQWLDDTLATDGMTQKNK